MQREKNSVEQLRNKGLESFFNKLAPEVLRHETARRWLVHALRHRLNSDLRDARSSGVRPAGVDDDRNVLGISIIKSFDRMLSDSSLSPAFLDTIVNIAAKELFLKFGDQSAQKSFEKIYGIRPPTFLVISPGKACNLRCVGCYADSGKAAEKLDWDIFDEIVSQAVDLWGTRFIVISGGEPLVYRSQGKGLLDLVEKHPEVLFMSYTNGSLITDELAERMARAGNLSPAISIEGWKERTDARRGEGVYDRILQAMERLRTAGVPFGISLTATRQNAEEILSDDLIDFLFFNQRAAYGWIFQYMPIGRSYTLDLMVTPRQRLWMWRRSWELMRNRGIFLADFWNQGTVCDGCLSAGSDTAGGYFHIDWNGAVTPCVFMPYSPLNINTLFADGKNLNDMWENPFFAEIRQWQHEYHSRRDNWLMPCPIRDHHAEFRKMVAKHAPEPTDENAHAALLDPQYTAGMQRYDEEYEALTHNVWQDHYLRPVDAGDTYIPDLPEIDESLPNPEDRLERV